MARVPSSDARVVYAKLTDEGLARLEQASASHLVSIRALFADHFSEDELRTLRELLERLPQTASSC